MQRLAFKMKLKPGSEAEYEKRHARLWPEMKLLLKEGGIGNYSIFYDPAPLTLFPYLEWGGDGSAQELGGEAVVRKWWDYMSDIMEVNADNSPVSVPLRQVFFLE